VKCLNKRLQKLLILTILNPSICNLMFPETNNSRLWAILEVKLANEMSGCPLWMLMGVKCPNVKLQILPLVLRFKLRALCFLCKCCTTWAILPVFFTLVYFSGRVFYFFSWLTLDHNPPTSAFHVAGITDMHHYTQVVGWDKVLLIFCPGWPGTSIFPSMPLV
jgi:hypothetical protein